MMVIEINRLLWGVAVYFFFIAKIEYKTIIKIKAMYSIGNTPLLGQDLTAYRYGRPFGCRSTVDIVSQYAVLVKSARI